MKSKLFFVLIAIILVISTEACTAKTSSTTSANALSGTTVSSTTSGKTLNNPPQVIEPATENNDVMIPLLSPLKIISITSPVLPGDTVTMVVQTAPNVYCWPSIADANVAKANGPGNAAVLPGAIVINPASIPGQMPGIARSDSNGRVTITFKVDSDSLPGYCRVIVQVSNFNPVSSPTIASPQESTVLTSFLVY